MNIKGSRFLKNRAGSAGVISLRTESYMKANRVMFQQNSAMEQAGALYTSTESYFDALDCTFDRNTASESSVLHVIGSSKTKNITMT